MKKSASNKNEDTIINMFLMIMLTLREVDIQTNLSQLEIRGSYYSIVVFSVEESHVAHFFLIRNIADAKGSRVGY
jgi:hypothetical protein